MTGDSQGVRFKRIRGRTPNGNGVGRTPAAMVGGEVIATWRPTPTRGRGTIYGRPTYATGYHQWRTFVVAAAKLRTPPP